MILIKTIVNLTFVCYFYNYLSYVCFTLHLVTIDFVYVSQTTGMTPLMYAVKDNRTSFVERLIELGSDVGARNNVSISLSSYCMHGNC